QVLAAMVLIVTLGDRDAPLAVYLADRARRIERSPGIADQVSIESLARADAACRVAYIAELHSHGIIWMTRSHNHRRLDAAAAHADLDNVVFFKIKFRQRGARDHRRIVPSQVRHRLG